MLYIPLFCLILFYYIYYVTFVTNSKKLYIELIFICFVRLQAA